VFSLFVYAAGRRLEGVGRRSDCAGQQPPQPGTTPRPQPVAGDPAWSGGGQRAKPQALGGRRRSG